MGRELPLSRRALLRGAGGVAIGLPFLESWSGRQARAQAVAPPPNRCITVFFGLGLPKALQAEGFAGPLQPLEAHRSKLALFRNVDMSEAKGQGHPAGGTCVFVGKGGSQDAAAGASIDQVMKDALYPSGVPTPIGTLAVGSFFRRSHGLYQRIRCWRPDGSKAVEPYESPAKLFAALFGTPAGGAPLPPEEPQAARAERLRRSVLDVVVGQYKSLTGGASPLGEASRRKLGDHLERLRELERRAFEAPDKPLPPTACATPSVPAEPALPYGRAGATEYDAVQVPAADFQRAFRLNAELYAMALRCDLVRFGNVMFESSGGHTAFSGLYRAPGHDYTFRSEASDHNNWHESRAYDIRWHAHFFQSQVAYVLSVLDDPAYWESNGRSVLDNALVLIGTETGTNHNMDGVFHAVAGGGGRFALGTVNDARVNAVDIYNTCLRAYGIDQLMGDANFYNGEITSLRR